MRTFLERVTVIESEAEIFLCDYLKAKNSEQIFNEETLNKFGDYSDSLHIILRDLDRYVIDKIIYKNNRVIGVSNGKELTLFREDIVYFASLIQEYL